MPTDDFGMANLLVVARCVSIKTTKLHDNDDDDDDATTKTMDALLNAVRFVWVFVSKKIRSNRNEFRSFYLIQLKLVKLTFTTSETESQKKSRRRDERSE